MYVVRWWVLSDSLLFFFKEKEFGIIFQEKGTKDKHFLTAPSSSLHLLFRLAPLVTGVWSLQSARFDAIADAIWMLMSHYLSDSFVHRLYIHLYFENLSWLYQYRSWLAYPHFRHHPSHGLSSNEICFNSYNKEERALNSEATFYDSTILMQVGFEEK